MSNIRNSFYSAAFVTGMVILSAKNALAFAPIKPVLKIPEPATDTLVVAGLIGIKKLSNRRKNKKTLDL